MEELTKKEEMTLQFAIALKDCFNDEDNRELEAFSPIDLDKDVDVNDIILAMFNAVRITFHVLTSYECDPIDFMAIIMHLLLQEVKNEDMHFKEKEIVIGDSEDTHDE